MRPETDSMDSCLKSDQAEEDNIVKTTGFSRKRKEKNGIPKTTTLRIVGIVLSAVKDLSRLQELAEIRWRLNRGLRTGLYGSERI